MCGKNGTNPANHSTRHSEMLDGLARKLSMMEQQIQAGENMELAANTLMMWRQDVDRQRAVMNHLLNKSIRPDG